MLPAFQPAASQCRSPCIQRASTRGPAACVCATCSRSTVAASWRRSRFTPLSHRFDFHVRPDAAEQDHSVFICNAIYSYVSSRPVPTSSPGWREQVWRVLTDYERLAEFVPNLERCERLPRGPNGRVRLRQVCSLTHGAGHGSACLPALLLLAHGGHANVSFAAAHAPYRRPAMRLHSTIHQPSSCARVSDVSTVLDAVRRGAAARGRCGDWQRRRCSRFRRCAAGSASGSSASTCSRATSRCATWLGMLTGG